MPFPKKRTSPSRTELARERADLRPRADEQRLKERLAQMPPLYRGQYKRAMQGRSRQSAIDAFCLMCVGWQRQEVALCTDPACPLWLHRKNYSNGDSGPT